VIRVLVVDDDGNLRRMLRAVLEAEGYDVEDAEGGEPGLNACEETEPDVVLLDLVMPPGPDGLAVLERIMARQDDIGVIMMSGKATLDDAVRATKLGAFQFLEKPLTPERVLTTVAAAAALARERAENRALRAGQPGGEEIVGATAVMQELRAQIARVAPLPSRVLITGESGTGKELVARAIHHQSPRGGRPMVSLNCAAIPRDLLESEMFGHERGAFSGAVARRRGKFELADGSTLFLDEVGDLHLDAQSKLLRVLETGTIERLGGERERAVDVRVLAASNKDLAEEVHGGRFREDLFFRLNVFPIRVPPLRDRLDDLPLLVEHLSRVVAARCTRRVRSVGPDAIARLKEHSWPGNVRELANVIERLTIAGVDRRVTVREIDGVLGLAGGAVKESLSLESDELSLSDALAAYERQLITQVLQASDGNVAAAARRLRTDRANLYRRMRRLGMSP
jgi:two-component system nitrogen regulation response regulator NtrX